jgi:hypothetical protein
MYHAKDVELGLAEMDDYAPLAPGAIAFCDPSASKDCGRLPQR